MLTTDLYLSRYNGGTMTDNDPAYTRYIDEQLGYIAKARQEIERQHSIIEGAHVMIEKYDRERLEV